MQLTEIVKAEVTKQLRAIKEENEAELNELKEENEELKAIKTSKLIEKFKKEDSVISIPGYMCENGKLAVAWVGTDPRAEIKRMSDELGFFQERREVLEAEIEKLKKEKEEKKYVENITIPVYEYLDDRDNQLVKSSFTFDMTPGSLQSMIDNLAKRCSYATSQYFAREEKKEEKRYTVPAHFHHKGDAIPTHTVPESSIEFGFSRLTKIINKFHTICDERGYADIEKLQRKNTKKLTSVNDARLAALKEIEKLKKENEELKKEKTTQVAYTIPSYRQEDGGKFTTLFTNANPQMYIDAMANELRLFQESKERLNSEIEKLKKEKGREVTVASYCHPKGLGNHSAVYTTSRVQETVDALVEQINGFHTFYMELKKENEELKNRITSIRSSAFSLAEDITGSIKELVSDIQADFKKKL